MATAQTIRSLEARRTLSVARTACERVSLIRSSAFFAGLPEAAYDEIASFSRYRIFARSESLFIQGEQVASHILLESGYVKHTQIGRNGTEVLLRFSAKGDIVTIQGETTSNVHNCSARAMELSRALVWDHHRIANFLLRYPKLTANISEILLRQIQELEDRYREMATEKVARRLGLVIVRLLEQIGKPSEDGVQIFIRREELAQMTGSTVSTVSRLLSEWAEHGLVIPRRESIVINYPRLNFERSVAGNGDKPVLFEMKLCADADSARHGKSPWLDEI